jgi:hypothetical protein
MSTKRVGLLQAAVSNFVTTAPPPRLPLVNDEIAVWYAKHGLVFHNGMYDDGRAYGFNAAGAKAIGELADTLLAGNPTIRAGTRWLTLANAMATAIHGMLPSLKPNAPITQTDVVGLESVVDKWFLEQAIKRKFLIPCAILPQHATAFAVGPVRFFSLQDLAAREGIPAERLLEDSRYGPLIQTLRSRSAFWLAEVEMSGFDEPVGAERANLAVDVALVAIQMSLPLFYSREIARITGRTTPPYIGSVFTTKHHTHFGIHQRGPGLGIPGAVFDQQLSGHRSLIESIGRRVDAYVNGTKTLPKLEQSWCDGAFWLHEGLAEPLSTVAVAKLETAVEVLLSAESSKNSAARFRAVFESFYGLKPTDPIGPNNPQTVNKFIASIVGARSRVLHGTSSTLSRDISRGEQDGRPVFEMLANDLLSRSTVALDGYAKDPTAIDAVEAFLAWVSQQRLSNPPQKST